MTYAELAILHWIVHPVLICILLWIVVGNIRWLSFPAVFLGAYFILIYVRALDVYANSIPNTSYLLSVWSIPYLLLLSAWVGLLVFGGSRQTVRHGIRNNAVSERDAFYAAMTPLMTAGVFLLSLIYVIDIGVGNVALFFLIASPGSAAEAMVLRITGMDSNVSPVLTLLYSYSRSLFLPLYGAFIAALWANKLVSRTHLLLAGAAVVAFSLFTAAKSPVAIVFASMVVAIYFVRKGEVGKRSVVVFVMLALVVPSAFYPLIAGIGGTDAALFAIEQLWRRVTWVPTFTSAQYFEFFPELFPFAGFGSNRALATLSGQDYVIPSQQIYQMLHTTDGGVAGGSVNTSYFASFYADWGAAGVVLGTIVIGVLCAGLQVFYDRWNRDGFGAAARAVSLVAVTQLMLTNMFSTALGRGFLSVPILVILIGSLVFILKIVSIGFTTPSETALTFTAAATTRE